MKKRYGNVPRFSDKDKLRMRRFYKKGLSIQFIARKFNCRPNAIWNNVFDLSVPVRLSETQKKAALYYSTLTEKKVIKIRELSHKDKKIYPSAKIAEIFGISATAALGIIRGKTFRWVEGWTRPHDTEEPVYLKPIETRRETRISDKKAGRKKGQKITVKPGALLKLAKKYKVSPSAVCRWIKNGKIKYVPEE